MTVLKVVIQDMLRHPPNLPMVVTVNHRHPYNMVDQAINRYDALKLVTML